PKVRSFGERIVLFILNVVIFGRLERNLDAGDMFFLPHSVKEQAKILWRDGAAVAFYTTKRKGSLCGDGTGACYLLPVFDTVFVRRTYRRQGLGTAMLQDFCEAFREDEALGVSWPISPAMFQAPQGNSPEDVSSHGRTSPDDGPRQSGREGGKKVR
ncbi:F169B protein, partial [Crocuta crocuta]